MSTSDCIGGVSVSSMLKIMPDDYTWSFGLAYERPPIMIERHFFDPALHQEHARHGPLTEAVIHWSSPCTRMQSVSKPIFYWSLCGNVSCVKWSNDVLVMRELNVGIGRSAADLRSSRCVSGFL